MATKRCNHMTRQYTYRRRPDGNEEADALFCLGCGVRLGMGPSNDEPEDVRVEMRAAEIAASIERDPEMCEYTPMDWIGWDIHFGRVDDALSGRMLSGWLAREIATHEERERDAANDVYADADAWPWDVTRPVAGQFEEQRQAIATEIKHDFAFLWSDADDAIRRLRDSAVEGTATDAITRHRCSIALGERGQLDRDPTPEEVTECRAAMLASFARRYAPAERPPPADPVLQAAAARYLESDEGRAATEARHPSILPCPKHPLLMAGECLACDMNGFGLAATSPAEAWAAYAEENIKTPDEFDAESLGDAVLKRGLP